MLEQSIIDAEQLKEAAQNNAKEAVIEKYQDEIREAVETILDQDEEISVFADEDTAEMMVDEDTGNLAFVEDLPAAQKTDMDEVVTIDLDKLEEMMAEEMENGGLDVNEMADREEIAEEIAEDDDEEIELDESDLAKILEEDEEIELEEETLKTILDEETEETKPVTKENVDEVVEEEKEIKEDNTELQKESKLLKKQNTKLLKEQKITINKLNLLEEKLNKYGTAIIKLKNKLEESNLTNARLLYQNRVLNSLSLNERQKDRIVEAISNAKSVEEAKIIFETLQSAVGSRSERKRPESLNEVVSRSSSAFIVRKQKEDSKSNTFTERMRILAGIKKN